MKIQHIILSVIFMFSTLAFAQTTGGAIHGKVIQPGNTAVPGVLVTLSSDGFGQKTAVTSALGNFRFLNLSPDTFRLQFEKAGFKTVIYRGVRIFSGKSKSLEIPLQTGTAAPPVVITGGSGAVDVRSSAKGANITKEMLQSLPTARNPWAVFNLVPGTMLDREEVGGSKSGQQSLTINPGVRDGDNAWYVDGADVSDISATGAAPAYLNTNSYEEIQVTTSANDITAQTGGSYLNFISRRGGNRFSGDIYVYAENNAYEMEQTLPQSIIDEGWGSTGIFRLYQYGANFGGPILKDNLWFYGSYGIQDIVCRTVTGRKDNTWLESMYGKIDFRFGNTSGFIRFSDDSKKKWDRYWLGETIQDYSARWEQNGHTKFYIGSLQQEIGNLVLNAKCSYVDMGFTLDPISGDVNPATGHLEGLDMFRYHVPRLYYGGSNFYYTVTRERLNLSLSGNYFIESLMGSDHEIRFGVDYCDSSNTSQSLFPNQREIYIHDRNNPSGYKQIWWQTDRILDLGFSRVSFYLADTITFGNLTANIGLRYDKETNSHNAVTLPALTFNGTPVYANYMGALAIPARNIAAAFEVFSPRISLTYDITGNGENVVKASFARYGSHGGFDSAFFLWPVWSREIDVTWNDYDNDLVPDWGEWSQDPADWLWWNIDKTNPYNAVSSNRIDPDYNSPILTEITLGFEKALAEDFVVALNAFYKRTTNLTRDIGLFSVTGSFDSSANWYTGGTYTFTDGSTKDYYLRHENPDALYRTNYGSKTYNDYKALQLAISKKLSHGWMLDASFTYSDWKSHYDPAEYFDKINFDFFDGGSFSIQSVELETSRVYLNSRWQAKIAGLIQLPYGFNVSAVFRVREGFINPFYEAFTRPGIGWTKIFEPGKKFGDDRLPTFWILNAGIEKTFAISPSLGVTLFVNGYNITNNSTTLKVNPLLGTSTTGQPMNIINPGIFQFGMRVKF
jgi:hypothetical protein